MARFTRVALALGLVGLMHQTPAAHWAEGWWYGASDHFELYAEGDEKHARRVLTDFEHVHAMLTRVIQVPESPGERTRLIVFSNARGFDKYKSAALSQAFWLATPDGDFVVMHSLAPGELPAAVHEYTHLILGRQGTESPLWLSEGLAEFYSTMKLEGSRIRLGLKPPRAVTGLAPGVTLIPLERLLEINDASLELRDLRRADVFYAESWALLHMLLSHERYRDRTELFIAILARGVPAVDALPLAYDKSVASIGGDLRAYVRRFTVPSVVVSGPITPSALVITSRPATDVEADVALAGLHGWQPTHEAQSRSAMSALEARAPALLRLAEVRGLLENYTRHCDAARSYLAKAVALGSVNPAVLRAYANLVGESQPEERRRLLAQATALSPMRLAGLSQPEVMVCG